MVSPTSLSVGKICVIVSGLLSRKRENPGADEYCKLGIINILVYKIIIVC